MLQSGTSVDEGYRSEVNSVGTSVSVVIISGVRGEVVRKNVTGYSLDDSLLTGVVNSPPTVVFSEGTSSVRGVIAVTGYREIATVDFSDEDGIVPEASSVDMGVGDVDSSLLIIGGSSEDMPAVTIEALDSSGEDVEVDSSVLLEYSVERVSSISDVDVPSVGLVSGILDDVSGISLSVRKVYISVSVLVVTLASLAVDTSEEVTDPVKVEMEDDVEGTTVDVVSVIPEEVTSGMRLDIVSPNDVNLEDKDTISEAEVSESEYIS